jgi:putative ABC transport system permease protein
VSTRAQLITGNQNWNSRAEGTDVDYPFIRSWSMKYGTFFSPLDVTSAAKVAVIGSIVSDMLFGENVDPTGQIVRINNMPVRVVGVLAAKGQSSMGQDQDDTVLMPYTTVQKKLLGIQHLNNITASAHRADQVDAVVEAIAAALRIQHEIRPGEDDDFMVRSLEEMASVRTESLRTMTTLLAGIAGVSLLVGGIGIMNIMLVSVTERTREIGLRMAIGARSRDVLTQFLVEAVLISMIGGAIGLGMGFGVSEVVKRFLEWPSLVPPEAVLMAFGFAGGTGIFFGFYPARKAARLDPIDALRYE